MLSNIVTMFNLFFFPRRICYRIHICITKHSIPDLNLCPRRSGFRRIMMKAISLIKLVDKALWYLATCWFFALSLIKNLAFYRYFTHYHFKYRLNYRTQDRSQFSEILFFVLFFQWTVRKLYFLIFNFI